MARSATRKDLVLEGSEHDGTLAVVGMTTSEGSCGWVHDHASSLYAAGQRPRP